MKLILFSFLMALSQTIILDRLACGEKWQMKKRIYLDSLNYIIFFTCCIVKLSCQGSMDIFSAYILFITYALLFLVQKWLGVRGKAFFTTLCNMILIALMGDLMALGIIRYVLRYSYLPGWRENGGGIATIVSNCTQLVLVFFVSYARKRQLFSYKIKSSYGRITIPIVTAHNLSLFIVIFLLSFQNQQLIFYTAMIMVEIIFALGLCYVFSKTIHHDEMKKIKWQLSILEKETQQNYQCYKELEERYENLHRLRHDFNNLINTVCVVSQNGDYEKAKKMLNSMDAMLGENSDGR